MNNEIVLRGVLKELVEAAAGRYSYLQEISEKRYRDAMTRARIILGMDTNASVGVDDRD